MRSVIVMSRSSMKLVDCCQMSSRNMYLVRQMFVVNVKVIRPIAS